MKLHVQKWALLFVLLPAIQLLQAQELRHVQQRTANGVLEGVVAPMERCARSRGFPTRRRRWGRFVEGAAARFVMERRPESR